jgi:hypothetical protein
MAYKFAVVTGNFHRIEMFAYFFYTVRVTNRDHGRGQFLGPEIKMVNGAAAVDDEFAFCNPVHIMILSPQISHFTDLESLLSGKITFLHPAPIIAPQQVPGRIGSPRPCQEHPWKNSDRTRYAPVSHQIPFRESHIIEFE